MNLRPEGIIFSGTELETLGLPDENPFLYSRGDEFYHLARELHKAHRELGNYEEVIMLAGIMSVLKTQKAVSPESQIFADNCPEQNSCPQLSDDQIVVRDGFRRHGFFARYR